MILDERLRWMGFWMLDKAKGGKIREYYDQIRYAWKEGSSVKETEKSGGYFTVRSSGGKQRYLPSAV